MNSSTSSVATTTDSELHRMMRNTPILQVSQQAVEATALLDGYCRGPVLGNLSLQLHSRFNRSDAIDDLEMAIETSRQAVAVTAPHSYHCEDLKTEPVVQIQSTGSGGRPPGGG